MVVNFHEETDAITILTPLILISIGGAVSVVGLASHVTPRGVSHQRSKRESCPHVGCKCSGIYHYTDCPEQARSNERIECALAHRAMHRPLVIGPANTATLQSLTRRDEFT